MSAAAVAPQITPSFVSPASSVLEPSRSWGPLVVTLFKKVMSEQFETLDEFEKDINEIYLSMSRCLLKTHRANPLSAQRETIQKATAELYQTIVAAKKEGRPSEQLFTEIVSSVVFKSLVPMDEFRVSCAALIHRIVPATLFELPNVKKISAVIEWFTCAYLFVVNHTDLDQEYRMLGIYSEDVTVKIKKPREELLEFVYQKFSKIELGQLTAIIEDSTKVVPDSGKVKEAYQKYLALIALTKDDKADYSDVLRKSLLYRFILLSAKLTGNRDERKA